MFFVGAAPLKQKTIDYFASIDMPLLNAYGMSECTGPTAWQSLSKMSLSSAGFPLPSTDVKILSPYSNGVGEVRIKGRHVMMGYLKNPEATKQIFDSDGYIHSGDLGRLDAPGFLFITGRIKELIVTAGGENVAPLMIEDRLKSECQIASNVMVVGDQYKYLVALITLPTEIDSKGVMSNVLTEECRHLLKTLLDVDV